MPHPIWKRLTLKLNRSNEALREHHCDYGAFWKHVLYFAHFLQILRAGNTFKRWRITYQQNSGPYLSWVDFPYFSASFLWKSRKNSAFRRLKTLERIPKRVYLWPRWIVLVLVLFLRHVLPICCQRPEKYLNTTRKMEILGIFTGM